MAKATITFHKCIQDSQEYGSDNEHMVSRVFFTLEMEDRDPEDLQVDIKQLVGSDFETGPIEVSWPKDYDGPMNYDAFRNAVEAYYRSLVGSQGSSIHIEGSKNIRMYNNTHAKETVVELDVKQGSSPW